VLVWLRTVLTAAHARLARVQVGGRKAAAPEYRFPPVV